MQGGVADDDDLDSDSDEDDNMDVLESKLTCN